MKLLFRNSIFLLAVACSAFATDLRAYVGKNVCGPEFQNPQEYYGVWLDATQHAYLLAETLNHQPLLFLLQRKQNEDHCGVVRDVVAARSNNEVFIFGCQSPTDPSAVIIGTWPKRHKGFSGVSTEAWKIDLSVLKFVRNRSHAKCRLCDNAGYDEGDDLATWAKQRAKKGAKATANKRG